MADWHVGQQIVCIDDNWIMDGPDDPLRGTQFPVLHGIYTIGEIIDIYDDGIGLYVAEIDSVCSYYTWHFRPVRKTNIDIFTNMLKERELENS